jgi:flagellar biogenesis protein FliO
MGNIADSPVIMLPVLIIVGGLIWLVVRLVRRRDTPKAPPIP